MPPEIIIVALAGTVATLATAFAATYRDQLNRAEARLERQEKREESILGEVRENNTQMLSALTVIGASVAKTGEYIAELTIIQRDRGGRPGSGRREGT